MRLTELYDHRGIVDPEIKGLTTDSRAVKPGWLFAAMPGAKTDGQRFISDALSRGAVAILAPGNVMMPDESRAVLITDDNPRRLFSTIVARFYRRQPKIITAVTGTNGKTSTAIFTQQIWQALGYQAASIGTLGVRAPGREDYGALTTPDPVSLHAELATLADAGITHLSMEASSHGLDQHRLDGVHITAAGFTNLTRDHLDYHATMADYLTAKARLFTDLLPPGGVAVLNADVPEFSSLRAACDQRKIEVIGYGQNGGRLRLLNRTPVAGGQDIMLEIDGHRHAIHLPLVGAFQVMNVLCALGLVMAQESSDNIKKTLEFLPHLQGAPGRLQSVPGHPRGAAIYVDYAHTPDALQNALSAVRPHTQGRLVCIMGCGGDRDPGKRPIMGSIAVASADLAIVTDDNPRTEDAAKIRAAVMAGAPGAREIGGRREAIRWAVQQLQTGDSLVIAGKGHERGQIIGQTVEPFDDVEEAQKAIKEIKS